MFEQQQEEQVKHSKDFGGFTWANGKQLLALLRCKILQKEVCDYAHAGEEEAIEKVFSQDIIPQDSNQEILDVGCGLGGTAAFIQEKGYGKVTAFDIEQTAIDYAKKRYSKVTFFTGDASYVDSLKQQLGDKKFDIICMFHAFCVFKEPTNALKVLSAFAKPTTVFAIFEYVDLSAESKHGITSCNIFTKAQFETALTNSGWTLCRTVDLQKEFIQWYKKLLDCAEDNKEEIIKKFGEDCYANFRKTYMPFLTALKNGSLGGGIFYAKLRCDSVKEEADKMKL